MRERESVCLKIYGLARRWTDRGHFIDKKKYMTSGIGKWTESWLRERV